MKTLEEKAYSFSINNNSNPEKDAKEYYGKEHILNEEEVYSYGLYKGFIAGYNETNKWYDIYDKEHIMPTDCEILIKLENGEIRRFDEDWQDEFGIIDGIVTHWRPIE